MGRVEQTLPGRDDQIRSAVVRVFTGGKLLRRPVQKLYPIEMSTRIDTTPDVDMEAVPESPPSQTRRSVRDQLEELL